jgi:hypothetical protein
VFHASLFAQQGILYRPFDDIPVIPVDYPPLSFPIVTAVGYLTGSLLTAGRAVSLFSFVAVAALVFKTVQVTTTSKLAGVIASLFWMALVSRIADAYVGMNDPQMLGHLFSTGALYLFCRWQPRLEGTRIWIVSLLCVVGIFTKHSLLAVPVALGLALLVSGRCNFIRFVVSGAVSGSLLLLGCLAWNGAPVISNLVETLPTASTELLQLQYRYFFVQRGLWALALPVLAFCLLKRSPGVFLSYLLSSFVFATLAMRGVGCDVNHLFDLFIAVALVLGACVAVFTEKVRRATASEHRFTSWRPLLLVVSMSAIATALTFNEFTLARFGSSDGVLEPSTISTVRLAQAALLFAAIAIACFVQRLVTCLRGFSLENAATILFLGIALGGAYFPVAKHYVQDLNALDYGALAAAERQYAADVQRLRSIQGPALFEDVLLGLDAGKDFLFDPFLGATLMSRGRLSEEVLIRRIREREFGAIVLRLKLPEAFEKKRKEAVSPKRNFSERWTDNVLRAIHEYYEPEFRAGAESYFFYRPRNSRQRF